MSRSIGMVEFQTVSTGMKAADIMIKTAEVEVLEANTVCPGKYLVIITGEISAVAAAVESGKHSFPDKVIDSFVLGNAHESLIPAMYGTTDIGKVEALGTLETFSAATAIAAADEAVKAAEVKLVDLRVARGMCGKSYFIVTGTVASVQAAIDRAAMYAGSRGMLLDTAVIANPDPKLIDKGIL